LPNRGRVILIVFLASLAGSSCGDPLPHPAGGATTRSAALAADRSNVARAAYYTAEVQQLREIARQERELSAAYARWTPDPSDRVITNYNEKLKADSDVLAGAEDRLAAQAQKAADFYAAQVAKELAR